MRGIISWFDLNNKCRDCKYLYLNKCLHFSGDPRYCMGPYLNLRYTSLDSELSKKFGKDSCPHCGGKIKRITKSTITDSRAKAMIDPCWYRCLSCKKEWRWDER